jgi:hypothetical protein
VSIFTTLCALSDDFDSAVRALEPGPQQDRLHALIQRLDDCIERTIGLEHATPFAQDEEPRHDAP